MSSFSGKGEGGAAPLPVRISSRRIRSPSHRPKEPRQEVFAVRPEIGEISQITLIFGQLQLVNIAYLALVAYGNAASLNVALCVRGRPGQNRMFCETCPQNFRIDFRKP